jgi:DNA-binding response OmpR family regulator
MEPVREPVLRVHHTGRELSPRDRDAPERTPRTKSPLHHSMLSRPPVERSEKDRSGANTGTIRPPVQLTTMRTRILIVEDDPDIAQLVARYLEKAGFSPELAVSGREALQAISAAAPDLVILDLMLPQVDGLEVCRILRRDASTSSIPLIMLTARAEESDRIVGLELGADDYLAKPFSPNELVARVRALLRRAHREKAPSRTLSYGLITMDSERHIVSSDGSDVTLTAKEFLLLEYFMQHRGRVLSRDVLLTDVWGYRYTGGTRTVDVHVRRLREKFPVLAEGLVTVKQFGYKLVDPVHKARS